MRLVLTFIAGFVVAAVVFVLAAYILLDPSNMGPRF